MHESPKTKLYRTLKLNELARLALGTPKEVFPSPNLIEPKSCQRFFSACPAPPPPPGKHGRNNSGTQQDFDDLRAKPRAEVKESHLRQSGRDFLCRILTHGLLGKV